MSDEQRVEQNLSTKNTGKVVIPEIPVRKQPEAEIPKPEIIEEPKEEVIRHNLFEEEVTPPPVKGPSLIPTTEFIENIEVRGVEEVTAISEVPEEDDFVIINAQEIIDELEVNEEEMISQQKEEDPDQMAFTFDLPLTKEVKDIEVKDYEEIIPEPVVAIEEPIQEIEKTPEIVRYQLEEEAEDIAVSKKVAVDKEEEVIFERRTLTPDAPKTVEETKDPLDQPISEALRARASERRARMKDFNYKFRSAASNIDEIEKQPAYKRAGLNLERANTESKVSRTSVSTDSNDDIQLRRNNSFLHDNVD